MDDRREDDRRSKEERKKVTISLCDPSFSDAEMNNSDSQDESKICLRVNSGCGYRNHIKSKSFEQKIETDIPPIPKYNSSKSVIQKIPFAAESENSRRSTVNSLDMPQIRTLRKRKHIAKELNTQLLQAIENGDIEEIEALLNNNANPNATCGQSLVTSCHLAALMNNNSLSLLISKGAESLRPDKHGRTSLHFAAWAGNKNQIAVLLGLPEDLRKKVARDVKLAEDDVKNVITTKQEIVNFPCNCGLEIFPPATWVDSMEHNCKEVTEKLPSVLPGWTPLHSASARAQADCVRLLLAAGANASVRDLNGMTPLDVVGSAHYDGYDIDVYMFRETIKILLDSGSRIDANRLGFCEHLTPLHTAVALESLEAIEELLAGGASPTSLNSQRLTPMHVCVEKRLGEHLKLLANHDFNNEDRVSIVDAQDKNGYTVLHYAVKLGWPQGVCIALGAGADAHIKAKNGDYPIHTAAKTGDINIFEEILTEILSTKGFEAVNCLNSEFRTVLIIAIMYKHKEIVELLLEKELNINVNLRNEENVLHIAAKVGCVDILDLLLIHTCFRTLVPNMINARTTIERCTPLMFAVINEYPEIVAMFISKGANVSIFGIYYDAILKQDIDTSALHIAASRGYSDIAKMIIDNDMDTIQVYNSVGRLPLHDACIHGNRDLITLLLHKGADLSKETNCKIKITAFHMLMDNISKPTAFIEEVFDTYISTSGMSLQDTNCEVKVNFGILVPNPTDPNQLKVINALVKTGNIYGQTKLLLHPLVQSFIWLKWKALLPFFKTILALYIFYVVVLNIYVIPKFMSIDGYEKNNTSIKYDNEVFVTLKAPGWKYLVYFATGLILMQEIAFVKIGGFRYFWNVETWLKFFAIILSFTLPSLLPDNDNETSISDGVRLIAGLALLLAWTELMYIVSRFSNCGYYVLMFGKVAGKVIKILLLFGSLMIGFSLCFMIQFHGKIPFDDPVSAMIKTFVMMTSEFDYSSTIVETKLADTYAGILILRLIFVLFLIIISVVLMNLMVGVAVNDVNNLEMIGNIKRLEKQIGFLASLEEIVCNKMMIKILPNQLNTRLSMRKKVNNNEIVLRPRQATCKYSRYFPRYIREAIFENVQFQKMQRDDELGMESFKQNLQEIHETIVRRPLNFDPTSWMIALEELNRNIKALQEDIDGLKKLATRQMRRPSI